MEKCKYCGHKPKIINIDGCYYVQCSCCGKRNPYSFLGNTKKAALKQWNDWNVIIPSNKEIKK